MKSFSARFQAAVEARLLAERASLPPRALRMSRSEIAACEAESIDARLPTRHEALVAAVLATTRLHPDWTPTAVGRAVGTSHPTVIRFQRAAGLYRAAVRIGRAWTQGPLCKKTNAAQPTGAKKP